MNLRRKYCTLYLTCRLSGLGGRSRESSRNGPGRVEDSDVTTESDDRSTVEFVKPYKSALTNIRKTSRK